jgi:hypothetical protein
MFVLKFPIIIVGQYINFFLDNIFLNGKEIRYLHFWQFINCNYIYNFSHIFLLKVVTMNFTFEFVIEIMFDKKTISS